MRTNIRCGIYCIENTENNKKYIGQSVNIDARWCQHRNELEHGEHYNDYLQKSWNKYGSDCFVFYIVEECDKSDLNEREIYYIKLYNTLDPQYGYNLKTGGQDCDYDLSDYSSAKLSESVRRSYTSELREKKRQLALKQWSDPDIKKKICGENNGMYGKHHTEEAKKKVGEKNKGRISSQRNTQEVLCVELNKVYPCAADAANELNCLSYCILAVCKGQRKTHNGYHWEFYKGNNK